MTDAVAVGTFRVDMNDLTIDEIDTIETIIDDSIDAVAKPGYRKGRFLKAVAYVMNRRTNPEFTLEDAGKLRIDVSNVKAADPKAPAEVVMPNRAERRAQSRRRA